MCVFVSRPMIIVNCLRKNADPAKRVVDGLRERDTFRNKIMEILEDSDEKGYNNNNGKPWKSARILRENPNFFISALFIIFLFPFSFIFLPFLSFSFIFCHVLSFSFSFSFMGAVDHPKTGNHEECASGRWACAQ